MPNYVTNKVKASRHVLESLLDRTGHVDFETVAKFEGPNVFNSIRCDAEMGAEIACGIPVSDYQPLAQLQLQNRANFKLGELDGVALNQYHGMVENYKQTGYLHSMDFARCVWGTKWNACSSKVELDEGVIEFDTAWSCPEGVITLLSKKFPNEQIHVTYADEDIGNNCGTFTMLNGEIIESDIAPYWNDQTDEEKAKWKQFAFDVKGWDINDFEDSE